MYGPCTEWRLMLGILGIFCTAGWRAAGRPHQGTAAARKRYCFPALVFQANCRARIFRVFMHGRNRSIKVAWSRTVTHYSTAILTILILLCLSSSSAVRSRRLDAQCQELGTAVPRIPESGAKSSVSQSVHRAGAGLSPVNPLDCLLWILQEKSGATT